MIYEYKCTICERHFDIEHSMSEVTNPTEDMLAKLKCPGSNHCEFITEEENHLCSQINFIREYSSVGHLKFGSLNVEEKQKILKKRATNDFKKNIEEKKRDLQGKAIKQLRNLGDK